jgi:hypothetical protein
MMDMVERPRFVEELLDRILYEWNLPIIDQQIALGVDGFYFADDWGAQAGLLFHPRMWRTFIKPRMAICYERVKQKGLCVGQHSDGDVVAVLPDLIEIGLDFFNPVDPNIYDPYSLKERFGDRLAFYGGINVKQTLPLGTPQDVRAEILERSERMGAGGGYILQSSHTMLPLQMRRWFQTLRGAPKVPLGPGRPVGPSVDVAHNADSARSNDLHRLPEGGTAGPLIPHLGGDLALRRRLAHQAGLVDRARQRFFDVHVFPHPHGGHGDRRVHVVGSADDNGIDVLLLVQHLAEVVVPRRLRILLEIRSGVLVVDL